MLRKMDKAKALTGECAGEPIKADKTGLTHEICREWKFYCPECYQFVHWRKSENKGNCFAHYDVEDKNCKKRVKSSSNNAAANINTNENQGQDLEGIQNEFENIIFNYIADNFKIKNELYKSILDNSIVQNCIEYYRVIINNDETLKEKVEVNYRNKIYSKNSYKIPRAVCKVLSIDMNIAILNKLIRYAIDINNSSSNSNPSNSLVETTVEFIIKIIADIDWTSIDCTRDKTKSKILENNEPSEKSILFYVVPSKVRIPFIKKINGVDKIIYSEENLRLEVVQSTIIEFLVI